MADELDLTKYHSCLESTCPIRAIGRVTDVVGLVVEAHGPVSCLGTVCDIYSKQSKHKITAEVSGFKNNNVLLMPLEEITFDDFDTSLITQLLPAVGIEMVKFCPSVAGSY